MRTLFIGALALNLVGCAYAPNPNRSAAQFDSKPEISKGKTQSKLTNPQPRSSAQFGKNKAAARATYTVAGKEEPLEAPLRPAQLNSTVGTAEPAFERAKASIAAILMNPASAEFYNLKRAVKKLLDESVDTICGFVKGKNASGVDTGEMAFLYIIRDDRDGEAYLVDGTSYTAQTVHGVLCK